MFVFIIESSDGGGHILITLILKDEHKTEHKYPPNLKNYYSDKLRQLHI
jgi:hypothetical protein